MIIPQHVRYKRYNEWTAEEKNILEEQKKKSPWLTNYHIEPKTGLLNDPNGFSYFNGKYHLFYQNWPFGPAHGLKSWVHTESEDLVHFTETGITLNPDTANDSHGAYSGSAYAIDDKLFLFYTGNVRDANWVRTPLQIGAYLDKDGQLTKIPNVLIPQPEDVTEHFRDPQLFEYNNQFYAIIGAQNHNKKGFIKLYKAIDNNIEHWAFVGNLDFNSNSSEYMIECPNLVFIDNHPILIYSPQGLAKTELNYQNIYPNTYKICQSFDTEEAKLHHASPIQNLDEGFDCYATQAFNAPDGKVFAVSWIGLPDIDYPTDQFSYQGALSLVKELSLSDGKLYQYPVSAIKKLRHKKEGLTTKRSTTNTYELALTIPKNQLTELTLFADNANQGFKITIDTQKGYITLDRSQTDYAFDVEHGQTRTCSISANETKLNIFVDKSIVEIFVNKGEKVLTSRYFPTKKQSGIIVDKDIITGHYYELRY